jgi:hypothetical protein
MADMVRMNQRRETRFAANQPVSITLFGEVEVRLPGRIRNVSGRGMGLEVAQPVSIGAPLKIEASDSLLLGEAIYCRADGDGFYVGVELEHALHDLVELGEMLRRYAEESSGTEHAHALQKAGGQDKEEPH